MRVLALLLVLVAFAGCERDESEGTACGDRAVESSDVPAVEGFTVTSNEAQEPEGCGAGFKRRLVYTSQPRDDDLLTAFARAITGKGWKTTPCVDAAERCFEKEGWFLATTVPAGGSLDGYPAPIGDGPQVLAVLQRR